MDPDTYPVMIQVFHNVHCLNLLRKAIWRDYYPDAMDILPDGTANRTSPKALHMVSEAISHQFSEYETGTDIRC